MFKLSTSELPEVFTDLIVVNSSSQIVALSLIGTEITVKGYRAKFMDSTLSRKMLNLWIYTAENKMVARVFKASMEFNLLPQVKTEQGLQVFLLQKDLLWATSREDLFLKVYQHLQELGIPSPTPIEEEFKLCMEQLLNEAIDSDYLTPCKVYGDMQDFWFYVTNVAYQVRFKQAAERIIAGFIEEDNTPEEITVGIEGVADYIEKYAAHIGDKIGQRVDYLHTPGDYDEGVFEKMTRRLFPQQKDIAVAASKRLELSNHVIISGQMGTGKTSIGTAACHYHANGKPYRTLVACPGHLVEKWAREIKEIIPEAKTHVFIGDDMRPWQEFYQLWKQSEVCTSPEYWIVSNEALRGGYITKPGFTIRKIKAYNAETDHYQWMDVTTCPHCGIDLDYPTKVEGEICFIKLHPDDFATHSSKNHKCRLCGEMLWQADNNRKGYRKVSIGDLIKKRIPKNFFTYFIADEAHKLKGSTAQGLAFGGVISKVQKTIAMTGTLADGYANGLYYLLFRMAPKQFLVKGYKHDEESRAKFQTEYGFWVKTVKVKDDSFGKSSKAKNTRSYVKPLPGYTINTFPVWLIERTVFLKLADVAPHLPPKNEYVNVVEMDEELSTAYHEIESTLRHEIKEGGSRVASIMLHTCLSYPDLAEGPDEISISTPDYSLYLPLPEMDKSKIYNKERELQEILKAEREQGRKCLVFTTYTNQKDCLPRIDWVCSQVPGVRTQVLRSNSTSSSKREKWVKDKLHNGANVLLCHPELVETGLDLLECPTIIWMQTGYIPATVRQASARSWRIGQDQPVKVIFLCYKDTLQEKCFQLTGSKLNAAGILEGNLSNEGLRNFGQEDTASFNSVLSMLKDNIVTKNSNDIFESYKAEVAQLLSKGKLSQQEAHRLKTLSEVLAESDIDMSKIAPRQRKKLMASAESQLVLFA